VNKLYLLLHFNNI